MPSPPSTPPSSWILAADYAGLLAQAQGLAEAAGLAAETRLLRPRAPWRWISARAWPSPLAALPPETLAPPLPDVLVGAGGMAAHVVAAIGRTRRADWPRIVQVQHPRMNLARFDLIVVNEHDGLSGPNVIVTRTALHRVTPTRLAEAAAVWTPRFAHIPRPLVAVLVGGGNGRFRLDGAVASRLAADIAGMMAADRAGVVLTPSRRTGVEVTAVLRDRLTPLGAVVWDGAGENPYFGMLALADAIIVTQDSVSMLSEAVATPVPVMSASLPGRSRRQELFTRAMLASGRVRNFAGRLDLWPTAPVNDTLDAGDEVRRRLGL